MKTHVYKWVAKLLVLLLLLGVTACKHESDEPEAPVPVVHRTILVYMVANNDLGLRGYDNADINEMLDAAQNGGLQGGRLIVYHAPFDKAAILKEVTADGVVTLKEYDDGVMSVSAGRMRQVIDDTKKMAPAEDYGIVLWSHASGWLQTGIAEPSVALSLDEKSVASTHAFGSDDGQHMNITTLADVLNGEDFSFVYCDCCYMANVETAYELRHATPYLIGSATELPGAGMRYDLNIPELMKPGTPGLIQSARNTYVHYSGQNLLRNQTCTMSVIATAGLDELAAATREIYTSGTFMPSSYDPQPFELGADCHYFDFANYIEAFMVSQELHDRWENAISDVVLYKVNTPWIWGSLEILTHCGLSTYPLIRQSQASNDGYNQLQWYKDVASHLYDPVQ